MSQFKAVIFDVDGVLVDSLPQHLKFCQDKSDEYGLPARVPDVEQFKKIIARGYKVSPMKNFFKTLDFPDDLAERADQAYQVNFAKNYPCPVFKGVQELLGALKAANIPIGIVTSNVKANVVAALGEGLMSFFQPDMVFCKDTPGFTTKEAALRSIIVLLKVFPSEALYVGDQPADHDAAKAAGMTFLGVTYGWGFNATNFDAPGIASDPIKVKYLVLNQTEPLPTPLELKPEAPKPTKIDPFDTKHRYTITFGKDASTTVIRDPDGNPLQMCIEASVELSHSTGLPVLVLKFLNPIILVDNKA